MSKRSKKTGIIFDVKDGEIFEIAGMEFVKFPAVDGKTPAVMKNCAFISTFGNNNDLRQSKVLKRMETEILPKIIEAVGEENVCTIKTDLRTLDGLKPYGEMYSRISLPTFDFYRDNVEIFDKHKINDWWWLATPDSAKDHGNDWWIVCVSPSGYINFINDFCGVRPFCIFNSSIFESSVIADGRE